MGKYIRISLSLAQARALLEAANMGDADCEAAKSEAGRGYTGPSLHKLRGALRILGCTIADVEKNATKDISP